MDFLIKRLPLILGSVIALIIVLVAVYFVFFRTVTPPGAVDGDPFGGSGSSDIPGGGAPSVLDGGIEFSGDAGVQVGPRLVRITAAPVAYGVAALYIPEVPAETNADGVIIPAIPPDIEVRFIERQSGNLYAYRVHARTLTRISNQTIPGVREAVWLSDGSQAYLRFLSEDAEIHMETYALPAEGEGGFFLEQDLMDVAATSTTGLLTLQSDTNGAIGTIASADGSTPKTAFTTTLSSFVSSFFGRGYLVSTKPSAGLSGYSFSVSSAGTWSRLLGPLPGLSVIGNQTGAEVLYSDSGTGGLRTTLMDTATHTAVPLPIATLAEKCVFSTDGGTAYCAVPRALGGTLPDDWYRGVVSFSDRIWQVSIGERSATLLVDPTEVGQVDIDAVSLTPDPTNDVLVFTNKKDGSLWVYDL